MTITIPIPADLERELRAQTPDLDSAAKEALLVSLFRQGHLTHKQFAGGLDLDRWQAEEILKKHNVTEDLPTIEEIREQVQSSAALQKQA